MKKGSNNNSSIDFQYVSGKYFIQFQLFVKIKFANKETQIQLNFLNYFGSSSKIQEYDDQNKEKVENVFNQTLDQFYNVMEKHAFKTKTSAQILVNLLSFQKQLENPKYDFKGQEFEVYNEDIIGGDFKSMAFQLSKAHYVEKVSMFFQNTNITDESIKFLSLIFVLNKYITNMKLMIGQNSQITNLSVLFLLTALSLNKNIQSIELEYNNCHKINIETITNQISSFLHYKATSGSLIEVNISGGFSEIKRPLFPQSFQRLERIDLHVSNLIPKCDDLLINICSGLSNNTNLQVFSLDFKNNMLTSKGLDALADILDPKGQESKLRELKLSLSGVKQNSNASTSLPKLGDILAKMKSLYKLEIAMNDFNMDSESFGQFVGYLRDKEGLPLSWFMISYLDNENIKLKDELILGEIYSPNYLLIGLNIDITNNVIKIKNTNVDEKTISFKDIKQMGDSIYNYPKCCSLDLLQFRVERKNKMQHLFSYLHIGAGCNIKSLISQIKSPQPQWNQFSHFLFINKLQMIVIYKLLFDVLPLSIPQVVFDLREDLADFLCSRFNI